MAKPITHQFSLFGFNDLRPIKKVPISKERIQQVQALIEERNGKLKTQLSVADGKKAEHMLREVRQSLEAYLNRLK